VLSHYERVESALFQSFRQRIWANALIGGDRANTELHLLSSWRLKLWAVRARSEQPRCSRSMAYLMITGAEHAGCPYISDAGDRLAS
jgi:hypothetical protein